MVMVEFQLAEKILDEIQLVEKLNGRIWPKNTKMVKHGCKSRERRSTRPLPIWPFFKFRKIEIWPN